MRAMPMSESGHWLKIPHARGTAALPQPTEEARRRLHSSQVPSAAVATMSALERVNPYQRTLKRTPAPGGSVPASDSCTAARGDYVLKTRLVPVHKRTFFRGAEGRRVGRLSAGA